MVDPLSDKSAATTVDLAIERLRSQLEDPDQAPAVLGLLTLGNLVMLSGLPDLVNNEELMGWLMTTADAVKANPQLSDEMGAAGAQLLSQVRSQVGPRAPRR